jgi:hypothetical protein
MDEPKAEAVFALVLLAASIVAGKGSHMDVSRAKELAKELLADEQKKEKRKG